MISLTKKKKRKKKKSDFQRNTMGWPDRHECFVIPSKHKAIRASSLSMEEILSSCVVMVKKQEGICLED
jgi:hypothetical protein